MPPINIFYCSEVGHMRLLFEAEMYKLVKNIPYNDELNQAQISQLLILTSEEKSDCETLAEKLKPYLKENESLEILEIVEE